jgi:hypothetical protein
MTPQEIVQEELAIITRFFNREKEMDTIFILVNDDFHVSLPVIFNNTTEKDHASIRLRQLTAEAMPDYVIYVSEAWTVCVEDEDKDIPPSEHPDRIEIVLVTIEFKTGEQFLCTANIKRDNDTVQLEEFQVKPNPRSNTGRFMNFYPTPTPVP